MPDKKQEYLKKYKITEEEFLSFPKWTQGAVIRGGKTSAFTKKFLKEKPRQKTAKDSTYLPITDKFGVPTEEMAGFETASKKGKDTMAMQKFKISEAKKEGEKFKKPQTEQEKYDELVEKGLKEYGTIGTTRKNFAEDPAMKDVVDLLDSRALDITQSLYDAKDVLRKSQGKLSQARTEDVNKIYAQVTRLIQGDKTGNVAEKIEEVIFKNYGLTIQELNSLYKANQ